MLQNIQMNALLQPLPYLDLHGAFLYPSNLFKLFHMKSICKLAGLVIFQKNGVNPVVYNKHNKLLTSTRTSQGQCICCLNNTLLPPTTKLLTFAFLSNVMLCRDM